MTIRERKMKIFGLTKDEMKRFSSTDDLFDYVVEKQKRKIDRVKLWERIRKFLWREKKNESA